jgi:hypothetical protein
LKRIATTDPAFFNGMSSKEGGLLDYDPPKESWDSLFQNPALIHGLLKVAGNDKTQVDAKLRAILDVLKHNTVTIDVPGTSLPTTEPSRVEGWTRPGHRGKEL